MKNEITLIAVNSRNIARNTIKEMKLVSTRRDIEITLIDNGSLFKGLERWAVQVIIPMLETTDLVVCDQFVIEGEYHEVVKTARKILSLNRGSIASKPLFVGVLSFAKSEMHGVKCKDRAITVYTKKSIK